MAERNYLSIENARFVFKNFSGKESKFNAAGHKNFGLIIPDDMVDQLMDEGWNVRILAPRDEGDEPVHYISVNVSYEQQPPVIYLISGRTKSVLDESSIGELDYADIVSADLVISPYHWEMGNKTGVKGYLRTAYITVQLDAFAQKYSDFEGC